MQQDSMPCACGCGVDLIPFDRWGRPRRYISGHNQRGVRVINRRGRPVETRFWAKVVKTETCWLWRGATSAFGYGQLRIEGRIYPAHRLSYMWANGPIPDGLFVLHHCDVPQCVNPEHLWVGTASENSLEMVAHGRHGKHRHRAS